MLKSAKGHVPEQIHRDLAAALRDVQLRFSDVREMSARRSEIIVQAIEAGKVSAPDWISLLKCHIYFCFCKFLHFQ